ncbi:Major Facilitator Superfamily protein [Amycolatopsis marina]|uniref:Major Facilitator Superfamily protein n=1 Tax=Amycolatopsis marina TaxID=490629 RepID=A0A1I1A6W7_9PSEU|nr:MFS transporter [Amycolatopsis marina]SFB33764.1 Major Facilitator Superfamily protein [Amycolatopsis marina]
MTEATPVLERTRWSAVVAVALGVVLAALDMSVVAVALPALGADFGAGPQVTQWVLLGYSLPLVALSIPAGRWLDRAGPLPSFLLAVGGFGVASVLIAVAPTMSLLLTGRVLQGVFGSLVGVAAMPLVAISVRPEHRARAMSIVLTLIPISGVAGPAVGGVLADAYGWRSVFLINVPIVAAAMWAGARTIPARLPGRVGLPLPGGRLVREAVVLGVAATAFFLALDLLGRAEGGVLVAVLGLVTLAAVTVWMRLPESQPVRSLLGRRELSLPMVALPMITAGIAALNFLVPYFLSEVQQASPRVIGMALLTVSAGMAVFSPLAGVLADRLGNRPVTLTGAAVVLGGLVALLFVDTDTTALGLVWPLVLVGIGNGLFAGPNAAEIMARTPAALMGTSSGVTSLLRTLGFSLGPALGALAWTAAAGGVHGFVGGVAVVATTALLALVAVGVSIRLGR